jgi:hypothetical protein
MTKATAVLLGPNEMLSVLISHKGFQCPSSPHHDEFPRSSSGSRSLPPVESFPCASPRAQISSKIFPTLCFSSMGGVTAWDSGSEGGGVDGLSDPRFTDTNRMPPPSRVGARGAGRVDGGVDATEGGPGWDLVARLAWAAVAAGRGPGAGAGAAALSHEDMLPALKRISGKEEVSFHMSGSGAVMCAVRLASFNARRRLTVVFNGAYHGWWDGVQPGPRQRARPRGHLHLKDISPIAPPGHPGARTRDRLRAGDARAGIQPLQHPRPTTW